MLKLKRKKKKTRQEQWRIRGRKPEICDSETWQLKGGQQKPYFNEAY